MNNDTYKMVTDRIVAAIEAGTPPWRKSWTPIAGAVTPGFAGRPLRENGAAYTGINTLSLWCAGMLKGYSSPYWFTFKRALELGACVRKGEKSELAFYVSTFTPKDKRETLAPDELASAERPFLKAYHVFNTAQIDGLPDKYLRATIPASAVTEAGRIPAADKLAADTGATIRHGGNRACFIPSLDAIAMPLFQQFNTPAAYYSTLLHELTHWSGAEKRLDRIKRTARYGDESYAFEELVAELGAAFLCADLAIANETEQSAAYLKGWLKVLKSDPRAIFQAASLAERAATFLKSSVGTNPTPPKPDHDETAPVVIALPPIAAPEPTAAAAVVSEAAASASIIALPAPLAPASAAIVRLPVKRRARKSKATLADGAMAPAAVALDSYPAEFRRSYESIMRHGAEKPANGEAFARLLAIAKVNAAAEFGARWAFVPGASVIARVPARWAAISIFGRTCRMARDQRIPAARFWPQGTMPAGLDCLTRDAADEPILYGDTMRDAAARLRYERDYHKPQIAEAAD